jgi:hypothetical protein
MVPLVKSGTAIPTAFSTNDKGVSMLIGESVSRVLMGRSTLSMPIVIRSIPFLIALTGCAGEEVSGSASNSELARVANGEEDPIISLAPTLTGVTAHVTWDHPPDIRVAGYTISYEKRPSGDQDSEESEVEDVEPSQCVYGDSQTIAAPPAIITGLEPDTRYNFMIRAFNESESLCSNEITAVTPPAES